jgi:hypothetical protein
VPEHGTSSPRRAGEQPAEPDLHPLATRRPGSWVRWIWGPAGCGQGRGWPVAAQHGVPPWSRTGLKSERCRRSPACAHSEASAAAGAPAGGGIAATPAPPPCRRSRWSVSRVRHPAAEGIKKQAERDHPGSRFRAKAARPGGATGGRSQSKTPWVPRSGGRNLRAAQRSECRGRLGHASRAGHVTKHTSARCRRALR